MMERSEVMAKAAAWMQARGWRRKLAKKRGGEQSLFEHTLIEINLSTALPRRLADVRSGHRAEDCGGQRSSPPELP